MFVLLRADRLDILAKTIEYLNALFVYFSDTPNSDANENFLNFKSKYFLRLSLLDILHELLSHKNYNIKNNSIVLISTLCQYSEYQQRLLLKNDIFDTLFILMKGYKIPNKLVAITAINAIIESKNEESIYHLINLGVIEILGLVLEDDVSLSCIYNTMTAFHNLFEFGEKKKIIKQILVDVLINKSDFLIRKYLAINEVSGKAKLVSNFLLNYS